MERRSDNTRSRGIDIDGRELAAIFVGGAIGGLGRSALAEALTAAPGSWPWATFAVNMAAALLLGYLVTRLQERLPPSTYRRALLATGVCGALSTFSTLLVQLLAMLEEERFGLAIAYAGVTLLGGLAAVALASKLVRRAGLAR